jgi:glycosyltransferase involved in cell wall biosynthesis
MNILFHHRTRGRGAEGVHIRGVVKGLRELKHKVYILSLPGADPEDEELAVPKAIAVEVNSPSSQEEKKSFLSKLTGLTKHLPEFIFEWIELFFNVISYFRLRREVKQHQIDCIYERYSLFLFASVWWAKRKGIPIVLEINDSCLVHRVRHLTFKGLARKLEEWIFSNATGLVFISNRFQEVATEAYPNIAPSVVSPNAADLDKFIINREAGIALREQLNINDKVVVGYVGAFVHWHGIDWFVDMIVDQLKAHPKLVLLLVGDGVCFEAIKSRTKDAGVETQIILPGRVEHAQIPSYLSAMDFGILPDSNDYGSPMKLFEFMAMEKGMVAPDFSPITEVVKHNETSWLFPANNRQACIDLTLSLVEQQEQQKQVGLNARSYIEKERQWRHNAEQIINLFNQKVSL